MSETGVNLPTPQRSGRSLTNDNTGGIRFRRTEPVESGVLESHRRASRAAALAPVIDIDRFYEAAPGQGSQVVKAIELLAGAAALVERARNIVATDALEADRTLQRFQLMLQDLFSCRTIGDGFGLIISSVQFAFGNLDEKLPTSDQLNIVWRVLRELRSRPALSFDDALQSVTELESHGWAVDPPALSLLLDQPEDE